jgi:hypothetical protein
LSYLFKLRLTRNAKRLVERAMVEPGWTDAGQGWQGKQSSLRLVGWSRHRRVILLRRPIERTVAMVTGDSSGRQLDLYFGEITANLAAKVFEYAVLVTSLPDEVLTVAQLYRDRATGENNFDELKNHWGWGGFTTRDPATLPIDGSDRSADLQLVVAVRATGRSRSAHRGDHQPAAVAVRGGAANPACQPDHDHHHQHARQGRPCSPNAGRGRDLLQVAAADSGAVERPPAMVPNPQPGPDQVPQGPSARTAPDPLPA